MSTIHYRHPYAELRETFGELAKKLHDEPHAPRYEDLDYRADDCIYDLKEAGRNIGVAADLCNGLMTMSMMRARHDPVLHNAIDRAQGELAGVTVEAMMLSAQIQRVLEIDALMNDPEKKGEQLSADDKDPRMRAGLYMGLVEAARLMQQLQGVTGTLKAIPDGNDDIEQCRDACLRVLIPAIADNSRRLELLVPRLSKHIENDMWEHEIDTADVVELRGQMERAIPTMKEDAPDAAALKLLQEDPFVLGGPIDYKKIAMDRVDETKAAAVPIPNRKAPQYAGQANVIDLAAIREGDTDRFRGRK